MKTSLASNPAVRTIGDAAFLACSWTWCIGMFLPVILLRDFGHWSVLAFLVPNVIGAASVAWWMKSDGDSERFVRNHRWAMLVFSACTTAFQWFFVVWLLRGLGLHPRSLLVIVALFAVYSLIPDDLRRRERRGLAGLVAIALSLALVVAWLASVGWKPGLTDLDPGTIGFIHKSHIGVAFAVCALGFFTCPLLDGTLHTVRQAHRGVSARRVFALGFYGLFVLLVGATFLYAPSVLRESTGRGVGITPVAASWWVLLHMAVQLSFTIASHERWATGVLPPARASRVGMVVMVPFIAGVAAGLAPVFIRKDMSERLTNPELIYRSFLGLYALVFPIYVLAFCLPARGKSPAPTPPRVLIAGLGLAASAVFFWSAFISMRTHRGYIAVGIAVGAALLARLIPGAMISVSDAGDPPPSPAPAPVPTGPSPPALSASATR